MRNRILAKLRMPDGTINPWVIAVTVTLATCLGVLVLFRILQGVGGGGLQPSEQAILNDTFPLEKRGMAFAVYGLAVVVAPTIGPWLGGWITDNFSWRWIFYINVPVGMISLLLTNFLVSDPPYMKKANMKAGFRIDYIGIGLISLGLGSMQIILDKGQREDWLSSNFIRVFFVLMLTGLIAGILWELREKEPVVDLRMLKDRNFAIATTAMFFLGFVLYASTVLIPQLLQQLLGYTAQLAGMALSPGGAVIMCMMPVVGILVSKVDTRTLITFGCIVSASALFVMAGWDLGLDYGHAVRARMLQSFGLAFLFIPINVAAFAYVPKEKTNMGTGIINLARNIGASVGIATVTTMLDRRAQFHQARLTEHVNDFSAAYHNMLNGTQTKLIAAGSTAAHAGAQAHAMIYGTIQRQAVMLAFIDNFKMLGVVFFAVIPVLVLMRKPRVPAGGVPAH